MRITLDLKKTLEENASGYFNKAKKARSKKQGALVAMEKTAAELAKKEAAHEKAQEHAQLLPVKKHWYHKYLWSRSRNGVLIVAGPSADANEALIKKHTLPEEVVLHTDMAGSPFAVLKGEATDEDIEDAALLVGCHSRAWKNGLATVDVFHVLAEQVTKEAQSGEFLPKGAFMIRGDTTYHHPELVLYVGLIQEDGHLPEVLAGSKEAVSSHCENYLAVAPGAEKTSDVAKKLVKKLGGTVDDFVKALPAGGCRLV